MAEHTFALLLSLVRQIPRFDAAMREGKWEKSSSGAEVRGKTLGLVGLGRIGREVAIRAAGFDMRLLAFDPVLERIGRGRIFRGTRAPGEVVRGKRLYLVAHAGRSTNPGNDQRARCEDEKRRAIINAARGELINEADLAAALKSGQVAGAALDVFAEEPPKNSPLIGLPNVIATPHVAGSTAEAQEELGIQVAVQVRDYLAEGIIKNAVNLPHFRRSSIGAYGPIWHWRKNLVR